MYQNGKCDVHKVPQGTQSPVTKLFKRQACNSSETVNLMKVKAERKKKGPQVPDSSKCACINVGLQTNSKDSRKTPDDTFSFTSCSLKKLLTSESPKLMMALIVVVGTLTVILVLKCVCCPAIINDLTPELRERRSDDAVNDEERKPWEASKAKLMNDFSDFTGKGARESKLQSGEGDYSDYSPPDLSSILDPIKVNEGYGSNKLRDFYRKLLKTDIQIKNLKKGFFNNKRANMDLTDADTPRLKRSLKSEVYRKHAELSNGDRQRKYKHYHLNGALKNNKNNEAEIGINPDLGEANDKGGKFEHEYKAEDKKYNNMHQKPTESDDLEEMKNKLLTHVEKLPNWVDKLINGGNVIFNNPIASTSYRHLLQHDDDVDNEASTEDYEDKTKEPWDREKRTINPVEVFIKTDTTSVATDMPSDEIRFNLKMQTGKNKAHEEYLNDKANNEDFEDNINSNELIPLAQAYSDYGVLDIKKEVSENTLAPRNTFKILTDKPHSNVDWFGFDNLHGRIKLESGGELKTENPTFFKRFRQKLFHSVTKKNDDKATKTTTLMKKISDVNETTTKPDQKICLKHKDRNLMYSGYRRSLKSVETDDDDSKYEVVETVSNVNSADQLDSNIHSENFSSDEIGSINTNEVNNATNVTYIKRMDNHDKKYLNFSNGSLRNDSASWGLGDMLGMLADFFMFMSGYDTNQNDSGYRYLHDIVTMLNPNYRQNKNKTLDKASNDTTAPESINPKLENIGHRSRVLMSFEESEVNVTSTTSYGKDINESYVTNINLNTSTESNKANLTKLESENRTVVKRSADSDSIFWNDMYDEEYGIKNPMEDDMREKSAVKFNELMGKDGWINTKFKKLTKSFKERRNRMMKKDRYLKTERNKTNHSIQKKRSVPEIEDSGKRVFESLTANVKRVCHEAALAITETTNREVRTDSDQASTLMQQLVTLMSELVNMQVREKTCVQLPDDLRSFLAWLTSPNANEHSDMDPVLNVHSLDDTMSSNARSECLGTIHDVEDLILQYDEMSEEDKSKMSGVREYLEHQLHYLHQQLSSFNEYGTSLMYQSMRRRRDQRNFFSKRKKLQANKLMNYYKKKHTKHTVSYTTDDYRNVKHNDGRNDIKHNKGSNEDNFQNIAKIKNEHRALRRNIDSDINLNDYLSALKVNDSLVKYDKM